MKFTQKKINKKLLLILYYYSSIPELKKKNSKQQKSRQQVKALPSMIGSKVHLNFTEPILDNNHASQSPVDS